MYVIYDYHEHNYTNFNNLMLAILNVESSILSKFLKILGVVFHAIAL